MSEAQKKCCPPWEVFCPPPLQIHSEQRAVSQGKAGSPQGGGGGKRDLLPPLVYAPDREFTQSVLFEPGLEGAQNFRRWVENSCTS